MFSLGIAEGTGCRVIPFEEALRTTPPLLEAPTPAPEVTPAPTTPAVSVPVVMSMPHEASAPATERPSAPSALPTAVRPPPVPDSPEPPLAGTAPAEGHQRVMRRLEQLRALQQQWLAIEEDYRTQLRTIEEEYDAALAQTAPGGAVTQARHLWHAYTQARRRQQEVYRVVQQRWAHLFVSYQQLLLAHQAAQQ